MRRPDDGRPAVPAGARPVPASRQDHNGATTPALKVEGHCRDEAPSAVAHPGDPLNTAPDGPARRSPARDGEAQPGRAGDPGRAGGPGHPADGAARPGRAPRPVIAVDAMGGDHAPDAIVAGALAAQREHGVRVLLTGPLARLRQVLGGMGAIDEVQVVPPGLAVVLPTRPGRTVLIDAGATADPKPEMLVQFGQLGVAYAQTALGVSAPRVGLLTIGTEPGKGNKFTRRAHELLASDPPHGALPLSFAGNVEGGDLLAGEVDVIVTDGFTGNVALKTLEGSVRFAIAELRGAVTATRAARVGAFLQRRGLRELAARLDTDSYGGAVLLGLGGTVVIAHGASTARAVTSACLLAADLARGEITEKITQRFGAGRPAGR